MFFWKLTTEHIGIWVGSLVTSSKDIAENTQETFDWDSSAVKTYLGYLCFIFYQKWTRLLSERTVLSSNTIGSLATISTATIYWISKCRLPVEPTTLQVMIDNSQPQKNLSFRFVIANRLYVCKVN